MNTFRPRCAADERTFSLRSSPLRSPSTNVSNGAFWQTYIFAAPKGSGRIELNGPPARHFQPGDKVIILGEAYLEPSEIKGLDPKIVIVEGEDSAAELTDRNRKFRLLAHSEVRNAD